MAKLTLEEIYECLTHDWKVGREIILEIDKLKGGKKEWPTKVSYGSFYPKIRRLVDEGYAERRTGEDSYGLYAEYRKTGKKYIREEKREEGMSFGGLEGALVPA